MKKLTKNLIPLTLTFCLLVPLAQTHASEVNQLILNSFSFQCPQVVTRDVGASLQNLNNLKVIVEELKNDADCGSSNQLNAVLNRYASLYEDFEALNLDKQNRIELEKRIAQYTQTLSDSDISDDLRVRLSEDLVLAQADLINIKAKLKRFEMFSGKEAKAANQLVLAMSCVAM